MEFYHNARCAKSREAYLLLRDRGVEPQVVEYMKEPVTPDELKAILKKLDMQPVDLVRTKENIWKEEFAGKELTGDEIILAMIEYPQLMERPILVNGNKAVVGRPPEKILEIVQL